MKLTIDTINEAVHFIVEPLQDAKKRYTYYEVLYMAYDEFKFLIYRTFRIPIFWRWTYSNARQEEVWAHRRS